MANQQIFNRIITQFKDINRAEIKKWRQALQLATNNDNPRVHALQDLYDNLEADGHFAAQKTIRKGATMSYGFSVVDRKTGDINPEKTELFNTEWFYDFMDSALDSIFKGHTILELVDPASMKFELIPRRNIVGSQNLILFEATGDKGIDISKGFEKTLVKVGKPTGVGLMGNLCGQLIWKRNAQQSWAEFTEKFGMPLLKATTNKTKPSDIEYIMRMLRTLGESALAVLSEGTTVEVVPFTVGDSYRVYDAQIHRINTEISKPITGGTMITDEGSSRAQSEVHERNLDDKIAEADRRMIQFTVNNQIIPIMNYWGHNINTQTDKFLFDSSFELTLKEHWEIVNQVWNRAEIQPEWISKTFNVPITKVRETPYFDTDNTSQSFQ